MYHKLWNCRTLVILSVTLLGCSQPNEPEPLFTFSKTPPTELTSPIKIERGEFWSDGGSVGVSLLDSNGKETYLFFSQNDWESKDYLGGRLYVGMPPNASLVPEDGQLELEIAKLLEAVIVQTYEDAGVASDKRKRYHSSEDSLNLGAAKGILSAIQYSADPALVYRFESDEEKPQSPAEPDGDSSD